jgi:hypothetical protein
MITEEKAPDAPGLKSLIVQGPAQGGNSGRPRFDRCLCQNINIAFLTADRDFPA